jgi:TatA/E family protein of Tat protein translocase
MPAAGAVLEYTMFGPIGLPEMLIILTIALVVFGPRKLPELGRSLGKSLNEFKRASNELKSTLEDEIRVEEQKEQRAKVEAEQASAVAAAQPPPEPDSPAETQVEVEPPAEGAPVSRTTSA